MTIEEQLKQMGLLERYQKVKSGEVAVPGYDPKQGVSKTETDAQKTVDAVSSPEDLTAPTTPVDFSQAPTIGYNAGDITASGSNLQAQFTKQSEDMSNSYEKLLKEQEDRLAEASKEKESYLAKLTGAITKREEEPVLDTQALYKEALAEYGMTPEKMQEVQGLIGQVTTYNEQIVNLESRKQASLDKMEDRPGIDIGFMTREQQRISRNYNREISTKAAQAGVVNQQIQLQRGLFDDARSTANQIISAATYDQTQKLADMEWAVDTYSDLFGIMDTEEKDAWNTAYVMQKDELKKQQDEIGSKLEMLTTAGENGVKLGWTMDYMKGKTVEELTAEYSKKMAERPAEVKDTASIREYNLAKEGGYTGTFAEWSGVPAAQRGQVAITLAQQPGAETDWSKDVVQGLKEAGINDDQILADAKEDGREDEVRAWLEEEYTGQAGGLLGQMGKGVEYLKEGLAYKLRSWLK